MKLDWKLFIIGILVVIDSIVSIAIQYYEPESMFLKWERLIRALIGVLLIFGVYNKKYLYFVGIFLIIDGIFSIILQIEEPLIMHLGRGFRIGLGVFLLLYIVFKEKEPKYFKI